MRTGGGGSGQLSGASGGGSLFGWDHVSKATAAGGEDWGLVLALESLALEFLVEAEDGALGGWSDVSGSTAGRKEDAVMGDGGVGSVDLGEVGWRNLGWGDTSVVTSTAAASVEDRLRWDTVDDLHFEGLGWCFV